MATLKRKDRADSLSSSPDRTPQPPRLSNHEDKVEKKPSIIQDRAIKLREDVAEALRKAKEIASSAGKYVDFPEPGPDSESIKHNKTVLANYFEVTLGLVELFKYRITIGEIMGRVTKKKETKKAMISSLMAAIKNSKPTILWVSDFDAIVITTSKIFDDSKAIDNSQIFINGDHHKYTKKIHYHNDGPEKPEA